MKIIKVIKADEPRWNRKEYKFYILLPDNKIESGWPSKEDAKETYDELKEMGIKVKLVALRTLQQMGIDPEDKSVWHKGDFNKFRKDGADISKNDADTSRSLYNKVTGISETLRDSIMDLNSCIASAKNAHESKTNAGINDILDNIIGQANRVIEKATACKNSLIGNAKN